LIGVAKASDGPGGLALVERAAPDPGPGQVVLDVHGAGVCGTDLHIEAGELPVPLGTILGHEVAGEVASVGAGVSEGWLGRRVVAETYFSTCGTCDRCREGRINLCDARRSIGIHVDGAFAAQVLLPVVNLHEVPDWLGAHAATLTEPLGCVCRCLLEPSAVMPGDRVLIVGPGPIGLLAAQVAALPGAAEVVVAGLPSDERRLEIARSLGFDTALATDGLGEFDVVVECSGSAGGATAALLAARKGGQYVQLGIFGKDVTVPLDELVLKELSVRTGYGTTPPAWRHALGLIRRHAVSLEPVVTEVAPLGDFARIFDDLRTGRAAKVVFDPRLEATGLGASTRLEGDVPSEAL